MSEPEADAPLPYSPRGLLQYLDWKVNPVLLRDLRLYMRGKVMLAAYFLTLAALVLLSVLYSVIARIDGTDGTGLLSLLTGLLAIICGAMIPNLLFERFRAELSNRATELALTSPLTPARLVRGKLLGAWCMTLMVVSASAPMLATSYLLGGINLLGMLGVVAGVVLAGMTVPVVQLSMAADAKGGKGLSRALAALLFVIELVAMIYYSRLLRLVFIQSSYRDGHAALVLAVVCIAAVLIAQFLYFNTVGILRGEAEDRAVVPRLSLSGAAVVGGALAYVLYLIFNASLGGGMTVPELLCIILCVVSFAYCIGFTAVCQSSPATPRNLMDNWRKKPLRSLFLLPGIRSLTAYFLLNAAVVLGGMLALRPMIESDWDWWRYCALATGPFMGIAYGVVVYYYIVLPIVKDKLNPKLLSHTIGIVNMVMALVSVFGMVMVSYVWEKAGFYTFILGTTPIGVVTAVGQDRDIATGAGVIGLATTGVLFIFLALIVLRRENESAARRKLGHEPR